MFLESIPWLAELTDLSVLIRLLLAFLFSSILGVEREHKGRPAGFRTYVIVCTGAALVAITGVFMTNQYGGEVTRMSAQVISGIGFLGVGTILVTKNQRVTGLTTAAGLWGDACLGLALGSGFYSGAIIYFIISYLTMKVLNRIDKKISRNSKYISVYIETNSDSIEVIIDSLREMGMRIVNMDIEKLKKRGGLAALTLDLVLKEEVPHENILNKINTIAEITYVEELK